MKQDDIAGQQIASIVFMWINNKINNNKKVDLN